MPDPSPAFRRLAARVCRDSYFLGSRLWAYAVAHRLGEEALAAALGVGVETLVHLQMCRAPEPGTWDGDLDRIAGKFGVDRKALDVICRARE